MGVALNSTTGSSQDTQEGRHGHREEATWRRRQRREGGTQTDKGDGFCTGTHDCRWEQPPLRVRFGQLGVRMLSPRPEGCSREGGYVGDNAQSVHWGASSQRVWTLMEIRSLCLGRQIAGAARDGYPPPLCRRGPCPVREQEGVGV